MMAAVAVAARAERMMRVFAWCFMGASGMLRGWAGVTDLHRQPDILIH
jgi:hypothetical protein